jgi:hypothetical protein
MIANPRQHNVTQFIAIAFATSAMWLSADSLAQRYGGKEQEPPKAAENKEQGLREVVGKPLQAAEALAKEKKFDEALAKIDEAEKAADRTEYENYFIHRLRATTALGAGKDAIAVKSLIAALDMPQMPAADKAKIADAIARVGYRIKDYKTAATYAARGLKEGGADDLRLIQGHAMYLTEDFAGAQREVGAYLAGVEKAGKKPPEDQYRLLASSANKAKDDAAYVAALEKLVVAYPKRDYWSDLVYRVEAKKGFSERLILDLFRLKMELGMLNASAEYLEMAGYVMQIGFPAEAKKVLDAAIENGTLTKDSTNEKYKKLTATIKKELADEQARAAKGATVPNTSVARLNNGFDLVVKGEHAKGLAMMEEGLKLPDLKRPEEARLRFGIAHVYAGQKDKASDIFKGITGLDGVTELARLWDLYARQKS